VAAHVRIIGSGLIGTSLGLALRAQGFDISMVDSVPERALLAQDLVGKPGEGPAGLVVIATPTSAFREVAEREFLLNPSAVFMDIGSVKTKPQVEIETISGFATRFCGTHPLAGREVGGPESARGDLFAGRRWVLTPSDHTAPDVIAYITKILVALDASIVVMSHQEHDAFVALISHLPQISASLLAGQLRGAADQAMDLSGQGLKDSTRIAASDPQLWSEILLENRAHILPLLEKMLTDLKKFIDGIDSPESIKNFVEHGQEGRARIPGKHGGRARDYSFLPIVIEDKAGQLAELFNECAIAGVNIEDLSIEHSPGQFTGLITLALSSQGAQILSQHLRERGWNVHSAR